MTAAALINALWAFACQLLAVYVVGFVLLSIGHEIIHRYTNIGRDDTDPAGGRSNLIILTDAKTGCQYLCSSRGGLTPRLDAKGQHICTDKEGSKV